MHCDGVAEHQLVRADQGERICWFHDGFNTPLHEPDDLVTVLDAAP